MSGQGPSRIAGVKEDLPPGERVLWQGAPSWGALARHAFHIREVALYFALLTAASGMASWTDARAWTACLLPAGLGALACMLLAALAWMSSRTTIYAITTGRVFMRIGIALPIAVNLPLRRIESASVALHADGCGDLPLCLEPGAHLAFLHLWPHVRPWRLKRPEPMLRSVVGAAQLAPILARALQAAHEIASASPPATAPLASVVRVASADHAARRIEAAA